MQKIKQLKNGVYISYNEATEENKKNMETWDEKIEPFTININIPKDPKEAARSAEQLGETYQPTCECGKTTKECLTADVQEFIKIARADYDTASPLFKPLYGIMVDRAEDLETSIKFISCYPMMVIAFSYLETLRAYHEVNKAYINIIDKEENSDGKK